MKQTHLLGSVRLGSVRSTTLLLVALAVVVVGFAVGGGGCTQVKSPLTGQQVTIEQAYRDQEARQSIDAAATKSETALAAAQAAKLREQEAAAVEAARLERQRRSERERREHDRFVLGVTTQAQLQVREAADKLADAGALSDAALEATVASVRAGIQSQIDEQAERVTRAAREREERSAQDHAAIDAAAAADAQRWAWINGVWGAVKPLAGIVPGGAGVADGINGLLTLAAGGAGIVALRERSKRAQTGEEKQRYQALIAEQEQQQKGIEKRAKALSSSLVKIVDSFEVVKDRLAPGVWDTIKSDVRSWQGPVAEQLVEAARNHQDPLKALAASEGG